MVAFVNKENTPPITYYSLLIASWTRFHLHQHRRDSIVPSTRALDQREGAEKRTSNAVGHKEGSGFDRDSTRHRNPGGHSALPVKGAKERGKQGRETRCVCICFISLNCTPFSSHLKHQLYSNPNQHFDQGTSSLFYSQGRKKPSQSTMVSTFGPFSGTRTLVALISTLAVALLMTTTHQVEASALTYNVAAHERACFYAWANEPKKKLAFYFAVSPRTFFCPFEGL